MNNPAYGGSEEETGGASFISHLPAILLQRRMLIVLPAVLCFIAAAIAAVLLPEKYESKSVLLIEAPLLPDEVVAGGSQGVVDQRMARIQQEVLSRPELIELIRTNGLYAKELESASLSDVIEEMRGSTAISPVNADIQQSRGNTRTTIAFSISFLYSDPVKAQTVMQALTEQVLRLDASRSSEQAENYVQFLTDQANDLQTQIAELDGQISKIKAENGMVLSSAGMTMISSNGSYQAQIMALQADNRRLMIQRDLAKTADNRDPIVAAAEQQLAAARATYTESHPDVVLAKQRLAEARKLASANLQKIPVDSVDSQIASNNAQIAALQAASAQDSARTSAALSAQSRAPVIMEQITQLQKRVDVLNGQYAGVSSRLMNARAGKKAEDSQQGERLTVLDPPVIPDKPISPNRPLIIAGGLVAGLGIGLLCALAMEIVMKPIRDLQAVRSVLGEAPLVAIPTISFDQQSERKWYQRLWPLRQRKIAEESE